MPLLKILTQLLSRIFMQGFWAMAAASHLASIGLKTIIPSRITEKNSSMKLRRCRKTFASCVLT